MVEKKQFEKPLKLMKLFLLFSGINLYKFQWHPIIEKLINSFLYNFNILVLYSVLFGEIYWLVDGIQIGRNFVEMSLTAPCITISILSTLKSLPIYLNKDVVLQIIDTLKDIHPEEMDESVNNNGFDMNEDTSNDLHERKFKKRDFGKFEDSGYFKNDLYEAVRDRQGIFGTENTGSIENDIKIKTAAEKLANESVNVLISVTSLLSIINVSVMIMFCFAPLISVFLKYFETGEMEVKYPFVVMYWFDVYEVRLWPLVYFHQVWATYIVCIKLFGTETLFYAVCTYIDMHFRILCHRFENIQHGPPRKVMGELVDGVKMHQQLIHLVEQAESLFSKPVLSHIVISSLLICLSAFNITVAKEMGTLFAFITFLVMSLSQISLLCFFGDKLMKSSTEVSGALYKCHWYDFDVNTKKVALIIILRAQKPCKLTAANFADLNLRAFTTILSRSWSYFALLKTVYN